MQQFDLQQRAHLRSSHWSGRLVLGRFVLTLAMNRSMGTEPGRFANRLVSLRRERGLTRQDLANLLQIHPTTLIAIEEGSYAPSLCLALRLSEFFGMPVEAIFSPTKSSI